MIPADAAVLLVLILASPVAALLLLSSWGFRVLARRLGKIPVDQRSWVERKPVVWTCASYLALYLLCFAYGTLVEAHWVVVTRTEIRVDRPVLGQERFRIVHLSDLHLERMGRRERSLVERVREAKPDLILLTGDYLNVREGGPALHEVLTGLASAAPRHGIHGVPGNWDAKFITGELFARAGADLIVDDTRLLEAGGQKLRLAGNDVPPGKPLRELLRGLNDGAFTIYLHHMPDAVDELETLEPGQKVDLFLCGHTHGGQVRLPFWGAVVTLSKYHKRFEKGRYEFKGVPMYVNRGVGCEGGAAPRVRFLAPPEVAVIELVYGGGESENQRIKNQGDRR